MFNIDTLGIRRRMLANAFVGRLMSILDDDHATVRQKLQAKCNNASNFSNLLVAMAGPGDIEA